MRAGRWASGEEDKSVSVEGGGEDGLFCVLDLNVIPGRADGTDLKADLMYLAWSRATSSSSSKQAEEVVGSGIVRKHDTRK